MLAFIHFISCNLSEYLTSSEYLAVVDSLNKKLGEYKAIGKSCKQEELSAEKLIEAYNLTYTLNEMFRIYIENLKSEIILQTLPTTRNEAFVSRLFVFNLTFIELEILSKSFKRQLFKLTETLETIGISRETAQAVIEGKTSIECIRNKFILQDSYVSDTNTEDSEEDDSSSDIEDKILEETFVEGVYIPK